jgi:hypothetical protein
MAERSSAHGVKRLDQLIVEGVQLALAPTSDASRLQSLRGIPHVSAVTLSVELGYITTSFESAGPEAV